MEFGPEATLLAQLVGSKSAKIAQLSVVLISRNGLICELKMEIIE